MGKWDGGLGVERGRTQLIVDIGRHLELAAMGLAKDTYPIPQQVTRTRLRGSAIPAKETSMQGARGLYGIAPSLYRQGMGVFWG